MMTAITFITAGGVLERHPEAQGRVPREQTGGWIVPWLERLDHHFEMYAWDVPWLKMEPSDLRRQCYISFDADESTLAFTTPRSPLVGADRIVWATDFPHPDAKYPGTTKMLAEAISSLTLEQQAIAGGNAARLYGLDLGAPR